MLFEIFDERNFEETICDPEHGIESRHVPKTTISDTINTVRNQYIVVRDFLIHALNKLPDYNILHGGHYMLMIDMRRDTIPADSLNVIVSKVKTFDFRLAIGETEVTGYVKIDGAENVIEYHRSTNESDLICARDATLLTPKFVDDPTSTGGSRIEWKQDDSCRHETKVSNGASPIDEGYVNFGNEKNNVPPFAVSGQQGETDTNQSADREDQSPIELSKNSFDVKEGVIEVKDPELEIGTVDDRSFNVDADKQAMQDAFYRTLNKKIRKARSSK